MAWRSLTRDDILTKLSGGELESIESQFDNSGTTLALVIDQATARVRGYICAHSANILGPEGTLPERLIADTVAYLVVELWSQTAGMLIDMDETRKLSAERAERLFREVAAGRYKIEDPVEIGTDNKAAPLPSLTSKKRHFTRAQQDGI